MAVTLTVDHMINQIKIEIKFIKSYEFEWKTKKYNNINQIKDLPQDLKETIHKMLNTKALDDSINQGKTISIS